MEDSINDGAVNLNTDVPPPEATALANSSILDGTAYSTKPEDQCGEEPQQSRQTVVSETEILWNSGVDLEQSPRGPPQPLVQQLAAHWEHCDRD